MRAQLAIALVSVVACTKPADGTVTAPSQSATSAVTTTHTASSSPSFGPAVLHAQSCPPPPAHPPPTIASRGCESCAPGEFCHVTNVRGTHVGQCIKSQCQGDVDCGRGMLCACGPPNLCYTATCRTSGDCGGRDCVALGQGAFCRTDNDTCKASSDCATDQECTYVGGESRWACRVRPPPPPPG